MTLNQLGGDLIGVGSYGCVFNPALRCQGEKGTRDKGKVSKLFFSDDGLQEVNQEFRINNLLKKAPNYLDWAEVWYKKCKPPSYTQLRKQDKSIEDCLDNNNIDISDFNKHRQMLQGNYGGNTLGEYMVTHFTKKVLHTHKLFTKEFLTLMKLLKPLFVGLKDMYKYKISHNDIKDDNVLITASGCKFIDFGLACEFSDRTFYEKRSKLEFASDRIYPSYPYEFIYLYTTAKVLRENDENYLQRNVYRHLHDRYEKIHALFGRNADSYVKALVKRFIKDGDTIRAKEESTIKSSLNTYSLGILIPYILYKLATEYGSYIQLKKVVTLRIVKSFMDLFKHMTEPDNVNRMNPDDSYDKYMELYTLYLIQGSNKKSRKRTNRRVRQ